MILFSAFNFVERKILALAAYRRTMRQMSQFSDRDFADIHSSSADVERLASEEARIVEDFVRSHGQKAPVKAFNLAA